MSNIFFFALAPWRLGIDVRIGAALDNVGHAISKPAADFLQHWRSAAVLNHIVQQRGNGTIFVAASLEHQGRDSHQVRNIGNSRCLPSLPRVLFSGECECTQESRPKPRLPLCALWLSLFCGHLHCFSPRRASKYARMKGCRSPSITRSTSPTSNLVR